MIQVSQNCIPFTVDSLDGFNSDVELVKLERCRTMPVSALYAAMMHAEEDQAARLANGLYEDLIEKNITVCAERLRYEVFATTWSSTKRAAKCYEPKQDSVLSATA